MCNLALSRSKKQTKVLPVPILTAYLDFMQPVSSKRMHAKNVYSSISECSQITTSALGLSQFGGAGTRS